MREKRDHRAGKGDDEEHINAKNILLSGDNTVETEPDYSNFLVNLFGIEFYTPDTPLKIAEQE